jgi:secondary thiamine-phosphate synthase enzyme
MAILSIPVPTRERTEFVNLTAQIADLIPPDFDGACLVFCPHTTAGLTINENADPDVMRDLRSEFDRLVPWENPAFQHMEGNSAAHLKASLCGSSVTVPVDKGRLRLGVWQAVYLCEFDGPRSRKVLIQLLGEGR